MAFQKIARVNLDHGFSVELGYEVPQVITQDTQMELTTKIVTDDPNKEIDLNSLDYKQAESVAEVLKIGFEIGCSYTTKVIEQVNKMGEEMLNSAPNTEVTGSTSDLVTE